MGERKRCHFGTFELQFNELNKREPRETQANNSRERNRNRERERERERERNIKNVSCVFLYVPLSLCGLELNVTFMDVKLKCFG